MSQAVAALLNPERSFFTVSTAWDSGYYIITAQRGYPTTVPHVHGTSAELVTAFFPGFPILVRIVKDVTGLSWFQAGFVACYGCSLLAVILLWFFVRQLRGRQVA